MFKVLGEAWPKNLETLLHRSFGIVFGRPKTDPVTAISDVFAMVNEHGDDGIIRHAIRYIDEKRWWTRNWDILQQFLVQSAIQYSHSFDYVARVVAWRARLGYDIDRRLWDELVQRLLAQYASLGRDSETL